MRINLTIHNLHLFRSSGMYSSGRHQHKKFMLTAWFLPWSTLEYLCDCVMRDIMALFPETRSAIEEDQGVNYRSIIADAFSICFRLCLLENAWCSKMAPPQFKLLAVFKHGLEEHNDSVKHITWPPQSSDINTFILFFSERTISMHVSIFQDHYLC